MWRRAVTRISMDGSCVRKKLYTYKVVYIFESNNFLKITLAWIEFYFLKSAEIIKLIFVPLG